MNFFAEMPELPNFGHMTTSTIEFEFHDKIFWRRHAQKLSYHIFYSKTHLF